MKKHSGGIYAEELEYLPMGSSPMTTALSRSVSFQRPEWKTMFMGLMSPWMMHASCKCETQRSSWENTAFTSVTVVGPPANLWDGMGWDGMGWDGIQYDRLGEG